MAVLASESPTPIPSLDHECAGLQEGYRFIAGVDEAGRGSLFGPVCVGMVVLPLDDVAWLKETLTQVRDSKKLYRPKVYRLAEEINEIAMAWGVGESTAAEIDRAGVGIMGAIRLAAERAWQQLHTQYSIKIDYLLTDSRMPVGHLGIPQKPLVKGDLLCLSIACGAILAKHFHDERIRQLVEENGYHEDYQLTQNVGYGTPAHISAIRERGRLPHHRHSFNLKAVQLPLPIGDGEF
jgi:ribonuclease HII